MDVIAPLVAGDEATEASEPGQGPPDHPTVSAEAIGALDAAPGDAGAYAAPAAVVAAPPVIEALVAVQPVGTAARPATTAAHRRHRIEHGRQRDGVVAVGRLQGQAERGAVPVDQDEPLRTGLAPVHRRRPGPGSPLLAREDEESTAARDQSIAPAACIRASSTSCTRSHTPAACQSRSRRQQVMPQPQPISLGSISQGMPLLSTNRTPVSAGRLSTGGRPPFGPGRGGSGSSGSITAQSSSGRSACAMPPATKQG